MKTTAILLFTLPFVLFKTIQSFPSDTIGNKTANNEATNTSDVEAAPARDNAHTLFDKTGIPSNDLSIPNIGSGFSANETRLPRNQTRNTQNSAFIENPHDEYWQRLNKEFVIEMPRIRKKRHNFNNCQEIKSDYFAVIQKIDGNVTQDICGGVFIGNQHVLTSATCCNSSNVEEYRVRAKSEQLNVQTYFRHLDFDGGQNMKLDLCFIVLEKPPADPDEIQILKVASNNEPICENNIHVVGINKTSGNKECPQFSMVNFTKCVPFLPHETSYEKDLSFCGQSDQQVCHLIEGSPYVCEDNKVHGIMMKGSTGHHRLFAKVGYFKNFVDRYLKFYM